MTDRPVQAVRVANGVYRVEHDGRADIVYVAGEPGDPWAFWNGHLYRGGRAAEALARRRDLGRDAQKIRETREAQETLTAPMPGTVIEVLVEPGSVVRKGDVVIVLEAMKMELAVRAPHDATVVAVHCRQGELVQSDATLVELK